MKPPWRRNGGKREQSDDEENYPTAFLDAAQCSDISRPMRGTQPPKIPRHFVAEFSPSKEQANLDNQPCVSFMDEPISKDDAKQKLPASTRRRWRKAAIWVTVLCIVVSLSLTIASFQSADEYDSSSALALAFDTANALLCSSVVLWRFAVEEENGSLGYKREKISCFVFAVAFTLSGVLTIALSIQKLLHNAHPMKTSALIVVLSSGCVLYCILASLQCYIAKKLHSSAMLGSSLDSGLSAALMAGLLISSFAYYFANTDLWYLDHSMAIVVSIVSIICGAEIFIQVLVHKTLPMDVLIT